MRHEFANNTSEIKGFHLKTIYLDASGVSYARISVKHDEIIIRKTNFYTFEGK